MHGANQVKSFTRKAGSANLAPGNDIQEEHARNT